MSNDDWLGEDTLPQLPAIVQDETKFNSMLEAIKLCSPKQRHYLSELQEACFDADIARRELSKKGVRISRQAIQRWEIEPAFVKALQHAVDYTLAAAAVSQVGVVAQLQRAVRVNGQTIKCKTENGEEYERFVDASAMLTSLDKLAKRLRMFADDTPQTMHREGPGLVIQINNGPQQQQAIDVTPERVVIDLPRPDK